MKKLVMIMLTVGAVAGVGIFLSWLVNWLCEDMGRYMLGLGVLAYVLYRIGKKEFGE